MYAVIKTGGKQYRVAPNDVIKIERTPGEVGEVVSFDEVLMVGGDKPSIGAPVVDGASVAGIVLEQARADKIIVFKKKRRQNYRRKKGHRQHLTVVRIAEVLTDGKAAGDYADMITAAKQQAEQRAERRSNAGQTKTASATDTSAEKAPKKAEPKKARKPEKSKDEVVKERAAIVDDTAPLFTKPEGPADDLTKINGIGPVIVDKLNELGITQFQQIANLTEDEVAKVDERLSFKGRIDREEWIAQAKDQVKANS